MTLTTALTHVANTALTFEKLNETLKYLATKYSVCIEEVSEEYNYICDTLK